SLRRRQGRAADRLDPEGRALDRVRPRASGGTRHGVGSLCSARRARCRRCRASGEGERRERGWMTGAELDSLRQAAVLLFAALVARLRPAWTFSLVLIAIPLRLPYFAETELATLVLLGSVIGRAPVVVAAIRAELGLFAATFALPA